MSRQELNPELYEMPREYRTRALPRPRPAPAKPYAHRRRTTRAAALPQIGALNLRFLQFWDAHALKAGMGAFWLWFAIANWGHVGALIG